ncbi:hypothetical protein HMPREF9629_00053 [Peptoanaerobacter stomatis]|uniref:Uncharacterized protein n=1 Tax=Peptoanaerobacter stomatis TaxID=796937 RepID=G9WXG4_9FIRM|nr:hypothetical protein [Peptoanaerobacter stomatis]EHL16811.1 hypothetical protein HMPREF9629_00053 [Peptoanaerobacter stomatis]
MKKLAILVGILVFSVLTPIAYGEQILTQEEKDILSYGRREGLYFDGDYNSRNRDYYRYYDDNDNYTTYYDNGRRYYVKEYTYTDRDDKKHYVRIRYYYGVNDEKIYDVEDYYYNSYGEKRYVKNDKDLRNYNSSSDIFSQESYSTKMIDDKRHYIYEDTYRYNGTKHYVTIDYYYRDGDKIYTIKDYYYDKDSDKRYTVDVDEKKLNDSDLRYYLEYYLKSDEYKDREKYYGTSRNRRDYGYYYDKNGRKIYYDDEYRNRRYYDDFKYTNEEDYLWKLNHMSNVRAKYKNGQKYFRDDKTYEYKYEYNKDYIKYNSIANLLPSKLPPNSNSWPKKENLTSKKRDFVDDLARQIEFERGYMGRNYFNQNVVDNLLKKYFQKAYEDTSNSKGRLEAFLYYFGFADAFYDKYNDTRDMRGFLYNYAEPMFLLYRNFESGYYTSKEINDMMNSDTKTKEQSQNTLRQKSPTQTQLDEKAYFEEKNKKIQQER